MMTSSLELSFDCKPQTYSTLSKYFRDHKSDQETQKIQEFLARLEEERIKIDAFKRELPICMQLLTNAMEASKQELEYHITKQESGPVLEEFIPLKTTSTSPQVMHNVSNLSSDKANWMISAQLWNQDTNPTDQSTDHDIKFDLKGKQRNDGSGAAVLPFPSNNGNSSTSAFPELALASSRLDKTMEGDNKNSTVPEKESNGNSTQTQRKARRCWSPDLHRRFVNALHMLGGSQVATPKQIRELMKVDGLTNDEVKSHLQKYRLHTRSISPTTQAQVTPGHHLVVLGGIWVPPEYAAHGGGAPAPALYGAHAAARAVPQENYHAIAPPPPKNQQHQHIFQHPHPFQAYNKPPVIKTMLAGNPSESTEDGNSENGSWKADSCDENGGKRMRVEESNASLVSLHF